MIGEELGTFKSLVMLTKLCSILRDAKSRTEQERQKVQEIPAALLEFDISLLEYELWLGAAEADLDKALQIYVDGMYAELEPEIIQRHKQEKPASVPYDPAHYKKCFTHLTKECLREYE